jgi:RNA polymerase sigma factor (sigma-70 family)
VDVSTLEPERVDVGPRREVAATFDATYRAHWPALARLGHLLAGSRSLGEEVAQEAFLGLLRHGDRVQDPAAYLRPSVVNLSVNLRRRSRREREQLAACREEVLLPPEVDDTWRVLARLPARQRAVLVLRFYEDLSEADIAEVLGCRPGTVKSLGSHGLRALRKELES